LQSEGGVGRQAVGEGISSQAAKVIIFQKFRPDPSFLDCGGLTPLWIFPIDALYSHPKLRQAGALQDTLIPTKRLGQLDNVLRAFASSRETLPQGLPSNVQTMSAGFYPDTSAAAFNAKSTFAFTLQVKPARQVAKSFPFAHRICLRGLPAILQLRLI
jgi:hypothetical protein